MSRTVVWLAVVVASLFVAVSPARAGVYRWPGVTLEQALDVIRQFEGRADIELAEEPRVYVENPEYLGSSGFAWSQEWVLTTATREYHISVHDPKQFWMFDEQIIDDEDGFYGEPFDEGKFEKRMMPWTQAEKIADDFARAHYPAFDVFNVRSKDINPDSGMSESKSTFVRDYDFSYAVELSDGIEVPLYCRVSVDSVFGRIVSYQQTYFPVLIDPTPWLDEEQAIAAAADALIYGEPFSAEAEGLNVTPPDEMGLERLARWVDIAGYDNLSEEHYEGHFVVAVDAQTGDILDVGIITGLVSGPKPTTPPRPKPLYEGPAQLLRAGKPLALSYPPMVIGSNIYIYLLNFPGLGIETEVLGPGRAKVTGPQNTGYVDARQGTLTFNGQPFLRYGKPVIIKGRTYVPLNFARRLLGVNLTVRRARATG
jgi:hypothetical protein